MTNAVLAKQKAAFKGAQKTAGSPTPQQEKQQQSQQQQANGGASLSTSIANTRAILGSFEKFQKERLHFVQTIADHASREHNIDILQQAGMVQEDTSECFSNISHHRLLL
jgi:hypothetical protein